MLDYSQHGQALILQLLVEPLAAVFTRLRGNCRDFVECTLLQFAWADRSGGCVAASLAAMAHAGRLGAFGLPATGRVRFESFTRQS